MSEPEATAAIPTKKYRSVVRAVFDRPWAILPEKFEAIQELVSMRSNGVEVSAADIEAATNGRRAGGTSAHGSLAIMPLFGVLSQRMNLMEQMSGGTSTETFGKVFRSAVNDPAVSHILLHIDSPGGDVFGTQELAQAIYQARGTKPITAVVDSLGASAAYWIASAADRVIVTPGGMVGSIGVLMAHVDTSEMQAKMGVATTVLRVPDYKAEGVAGEPLTDEARAHKMAMIAAYYDQFADAVAKHRGVSRAVVDSRFGQGRVVTARDALAAGMVDDIASFDAALNDITKGSVSIMSAINPLQGTTATEPFEDGKPFSAKDLAPNGPAKATAEQIMAAVKIATSIPAERRLSLASELMAEGVTYDNLLARIGSEAALESQSTGFTRIESRESEVDKFYQSAIGAMTTRALAGKRPEKVYDRRKDEYVAYVPSKERRLFGAVELGRECLARCGYDRSAVENLDKSAVARLMMGADSYQFGLRAASDGPAYNVSGMFSNVLLDASNVVARNSYDDTNTTFEMWMRRGESLPDFKEVHKIVSGELGDPKAIPENGEFEQTTMSDAREHYSLTVWGQMFSCTWQMVVNDQLGEFLKVPGKMGGAMKRKQNRLAYGVLKDNPTMADTGALFNDTAQTTAGGHKNLTTGSAVPTVLTLNAMTTRMMQMKGLDTASGALNLTPRYLLTSPTLSWSVKELLRSAANPAVGGSAAGSSGVANIWQGGLDLIVDAELGVAFGGSDTAWYLATDVGVSEHIEYAYLQGLETPALERAESFDTLAMRYRIYQAFAVHPIEYRGIQKHAGA